MSRNDVEYNRQWRARNREKLRIQRKKWRDRLREENPEAYAARYKTLAALPQPTKRRKKQVIDRCTEEYRAKSRARYANSTPEQREARRLRQQARNAARRHPLRRLTEKEKARNRSIERLRRSARIEAKETGENVYAIYERWDILIRKDAKHFTPELRLSLAMEKDATRWKQRQRASELTDA